mmetsp:Transcript_40160/g.66656  ORF Transcript_40160/g.66656 Transcript_40160/m.66656 type:complete len:241 (-) Transcript_40160:259-981(-)
MCTLCVRTRTLSSSTSLFGSNLSRRYHFGKLSYLHPAVHASSCGGALCGWCECNTSHSFQSCSASVVSTSSASRGRTRCASASCMTCLRWLSILCGSLRFSSTWCRPHACASLLWFCIMHLLESCTCSCCSPTSLPVSSRKPRKRRSVFSPSSFAQRATSELNGGTIGSMGASRSRSSTISSRSFLGTSCMLLHHGYAKSLSGMASHTSSAPSEKHSLFACAIFPACRSRWSLWTSCNHA